MSSKLLSVQVNDFSDFSAFRSSVPSSVDYEGGDLKGRWIINPYSWGMQLWDVVLIVGLFYTSVVTPFDAAFLSLTVWSTIFVLNLLVDLVFFVDIIVTFHLPYPDPVSGLWIQDKSKIAKRYMQSWFVIDVLSVFPFDWIVLLVGGENIDPQALRSLRLLKLLKIIRIVRGNRIYKRWRDRIGFNLTKLAMLFYISFTLLMAHWIACIIGAIPDLELGFLGPSEEEILAGAVVFNWKTEYFESTLGYPPGSYGVWTVYLASLYLSIMTLTTIGYGDVPPKTNMERVLMSFFMFFGASLQAFLIGTVCGLVAELTENATNFRKEMNALNEFMRVYSFPDDLRVRARRFFAYKHGTKDTNRYSHIFTQMSMGLQSETSVIVNSIWVQQVPFIEMSDPDETQGLVIALSKRLVIEIYAPFERVAKIGDAVSKLYIVSKGMVVLHIDSHPLEESENDLHVGKMHVRFSVGESIRSELVRGQCFGHELIFAGIKFLYNCTTTQFCEIHTLSKEDLDSTLEDFPKTQRVIHDYTERKRAQY